MLLNRDSDPGENFTGQITISELVSGYESVIDQPKLSVLKLSDLTEQDQHFQILTDKNVGILGPDGQPITADSIVSEAPDGQLVAVLDSGFTLPQVNNVSYMIGAQTLRSPPGAAVSLGRDIWPCARCRLGHD